MVLLDNLQLFNLNIGPSITHNNDWLPLNFSHHPEEMVELVELEEQLQALGTS